MTEAYMQYFQKSKIFLYPLLGIRKGEEFVPTETYICWDGLYSENNYKYICVYNINRNLKFKLFEDKVLKSHELLEMATIIDKNTQLYVFDLSKYKNDIDMFLNGSYSNFSISSKNKILKYFGNVGRIAGYIKSYLNPEEYHEVYAKALNVDIKIIQHAHEVCTPPDLMKETYKGKIPDEVALFQEINVPLDQN